MQPSWYFTSESVSEGHPDKLCDRISDEIVDFVYREAINTGSDPWQVRLACETLVTTNRVVIAGEVRLPPSLLLKDNNGQNILTNVGQPIINVSIFEKVVRQAIKDIGYQDPNFHWQNVAIEILLHQQSADIAQGVDQASDVALSEGAGDQGIMFGYACNETSSFMPAPIYYAHKILEELATARHNKIGEAALLGPDAKSQITVHYKNGKPYEVSSIVVSTQHIDPNWDSAKVRTTIEPYIFKALSEIKIAKDCKWYINPTGKFLIGGPVGDAGLTGRKIIVDTYGGAAPHGGGAFSGKDTTKVDRSGAYAARYLAKNIVAANLSEKCTIQLSYAIGIAKPLSIYVDLHNTGKVKESDIAAILPKLIDLSPSGIRRHLDLNKPIYAKTAAYGHFGRPATPDGYFSWEKTDLIDKLQKLL
ncbi:methionine adenosyltransferase [Bartonella sp. TP]|uniref:methionine adenosyltransferase n=1 Tax=Bartonella sp. TP TaxID=3057550 RepID=UPI0025B027F0|nr:methionine adenosyltransferase [Bartonella sp. TP]MDN5248564.1 methionine adenosyltransferase [Alphaproteobacteria bacterium]WJW80394.1 methionine adenosyltransferase [Bartonella sp. TP]